MNKVIDFFAHNDVVIAIGSASAIVTTAVFAIKTVRPLIRYIYRSWRDSSDAAERVRRRQNARRAILAAQYPSYLISAIAFQMSFAALSSFMMAFMAAQQMIGSFPLAPTKLDAVVSGIFMAMAAFTLIQAIYEIAALAYRVQTAVLRTRSRRIRAAR